jgi:nucleotide-binding universal stress UspA family protein
VILKGNPRNELLKYSKELGVDILVREALGWRTGINQFLLGSVSEKVDRHSKVLLMVVSFNVV